MVFLPKCWECGINECFVQGEIESTQGQIEMNNGKLTISVEGILGAYLDQSRSILF